MGELLVLGRRDDLGALIRRDPVRTDFRDRWNVGEVCLGERLWIPSLDPAPHPAGIDHQDGAALGDRHASGPGVGDGPNDEAFDLRVGACRGCARSNAVCFSPQQGVLDGELSERLVRAMKLLFELDHIGIALRSSRALLERVEGAVLGAFSDQTQLMGLDAPAPADLGVRRVLPRRLQEDLSLLVRREPLLAVFAVSQRSSSPGF